MKKLICENCKNEVNDSDKFCTHCGSQFLNDSKFVGSLEEEMESFLEMKDKLDKGSNYDVILAPASSNRKDAALGLFPKLKGYRKFEIIILMDKKRNGFITEGSNLDRIKVPSFIKKGELEDTVRTFMKNMSKYGT